MSVENTAAAAENPVKDIPAEGIEPDSEATVVQETDGRKNRKSRVDYPFLKGGFASFPPPGLDEEGRTLQAVDENGNPQVTFDDEGNEVPVLVDEVGGWKVVEFDYDVHLKPSASMFRNPMDYYRWLVNIHKPARIEDFETKQAEELAAFRQKMISDYSEVQSELDVVDKLEVSQDKLDVYVKVQKLRKEHPELFGEGGEMESIIADLQTLDN